MKRVAKFLLKSLLIIIILLNLIILFSGRWYLYKAVYTTYLQGKGGPSATEYQIFDNNKVAATNPKPWPKAKNYNTQQMPVDLDTKMKEVGSIAFVVIKNDTLLHEQYWDSFSDTSHTNSFSMAKSYTSVLLGFAIRDGYIKNENELVSNYIPEFKDGPRSKITLKHLATMSSGIGFDESYANPFSYPAEGYYGPDVMKATVKYDQMISEPGAVFNYLSGNTTLLGYCIKKAVGKTLSEYLSEKLWGPLNCEHDAYWSVDKKGGLEKAFCCINSNAKDFARVGKLYMHYGNWEGKQLLDSEYVANSIRPFDGKELDGSKNHTYGYAWWLTGYKGLRIFYMRGLLGQYVICIPQKKMIICKLAQKKRLPNLDHCPLDLAYSIDAAMAMYGDK